MSITATNVAAAVTQWFAVLDFPAQIVVGLTITLSLLSFGIAMFRSRRRKRW